MNCISVSAIFGFIIIIITSFVPSKESLSKKYKNFEEPKLIHVNVFAKKILKLGLGLAFIVIPVVMGIIMPRINNSSAREIFISLFILAIFFSISLFGAFWRVSGITEAEIKSRNADK